MRFYSSRQYFTLRGNILHFIVNVQWTFYTARQYLALRGKILHWIQSEFFLLKTDLLLLLRSEALRREIVIARLKTCDFVIKLNHKMLFIFSSNDDRTLIILYYILQQLTLPALWQTAVWCLLGCSNGMLLQRCFRGVIFYITLFD